MHRMRTPNVYIGRRGGMDPNWIYEIGPQEGRRKEDGWERKEENKGAKAGGGEWKLRFHSSF